MPILAPAGVQVDQPGLAGEDGGGEDVVGALAHGDDVDSTISGPNRSKASRMVRKTPRVLAPAASSGGRAWGPAGGASAAPWRAACGGSRGACPRSARILAEPVEELAERVVVGLGVLADVHGGQLQAERGEGADGAVEPAVGDELAAVRAQRVLDQLEVGEQLGGAEVVAAGHVRGARGEPVAGVDAASAACRWP